MADLLNGLEAPYEPASWDALRQKMEDTAPAPDSGVNHFDTRMKSVLEEMDAPFQSNHWDMLASRLDYLAVVKRIRFHKVAEAAIVILIVANFQAFLDGGARLFHMPAPVQETPATDRPMAENNRKSRATQSNTVEALPILATSSLFDTNIESIHSTTETGLVAAADLATAPASTIGQAMIGPDGQPIPSGLRPLTLMAALGLDLVKSIEPKPMAGVLPIQVSNSHRKSAQTWLMAYGGGYKHRLKDDKSYTTRFNAPLAGVSMAVRRGAWGVETGLAYAHQQYATATDVFDLHQSGDKVYGTSYDQVQAGVVSVPVKVTRRLARFGKNSIHATAGATANMAAVKNYKYKEIEYPSLPQGQTLPTQPVLPAANGAFEKGSVADNFYATIDAGVRFERKIAARLTAYVEPQYRQFAGGKSYGPQKSRMNSIGVQAGVMAAL